jgi:hypothetical protein
MVDPIIETVIFEGLLEHKNPKCTKCNNHCFALYQGGIKERMDDFFICKKCNILYKLPDEKKCNFMEENHA